MWGSGGGVLRWRWRWWGSEARVPHLIANARLAVYLKVGLHNAIALLVDLVRGALVTPTTAHVHATSIAGGVQIALSSMST